jgi:hypothetical protein
MAEKKNRQYMVTMIVSCGDGQTSFLIAERWGTRAKQFATGKHSVPQQRTQQRLSERAMPL